MRISTKGRYGLRVMVDLAMYDTGEYIALKDISKRQDISIKYLEQIMRMLSNAGMIKSARGASGGYKLAKKADYFSVGSVLQVCEGNLAPVECVVDEAFCTRCSNCVTRNFWCDLNTHIQSFLEQVTIADIAEKNQSFDYVI